MRPRACEGEEEEEEEEEEHFVATFRKRMAHWRRNGKCGRAARVSDVLLCSR